MRFSRAKKSFLVAATLATASVFAACGSRTGLDTDGVYANLFADANASLDGSLVGDGDAAHNVPCVPGVFTLSRARPAVMFIIDRSASMNTAFSGGRSRWTVLGEALAATLPAMDQQIQSGALIFPVNGGGGGGGGPGGGGAMSCNVPAHADLLPALGNAGAIVGLMKSTRPNGSTPTALAIDAAYGALAGFRAASTARAMVLATDGAPDCNAALDGRSCRCVGNGPGGGGGGGCGQRPERCLDDTRTEKSISIYAGQGVPTYVLGIESTGDTSFSDVLDAMAKAGGRPQIGAQAYYAASSETELNTALGTIVNQVGACTYLSASVPSADGLIEVTLDGKPVQPDPTGANGGWRWADESNGEILLTGQPCADAANAPTSAFDVTVTCDRPDAGQDAEASTDASLDGD